MKHLSKNKLVIHVSILLAIIMLTTSVIKGSIAYGAEAPAGDDNFNYNGYSATQLKKISECISDVVPESECPAYESSSKDYYTGTVHHVNMPTGVISTKAGWLQWADAAMKANSYDGVYGTLRISSEGGYQPSNEIGDVKFRLIGINQDNRADGTGKTGLTFQSIGIYNKIIPSNDKDYYEKYPSGSVMNGNHNSINSGGWRDTAVRKILNTRTSDGIIWNSIKSDDFRQNITPVLKTTNNGAYKPASYSDPVINVKPTITVDKLFILSPSEMGMPIIKDNSKIISSYSCSGDGMKNANVHYYKSGSYNKTIKSSNDGKDGKHTMYDCIEGLWNADSDYLYAGNTYQWWMLPAGSRKMSNGKQAYHNTDSYSYSAIVNNANPSINNKCPTAINNDSYWLRSPTRFSPNSDESFAIYNCHSIELSYDKSYIPNSVVIAFSF